MLITARELALMLQGTVEGNPEVTVSHPSKIEEGTPGSITFLANPRYEPYAYTTGASVLLVSRDFEPSGTVPATMIRVDDVYAAIAQLLERFGKQSAAPGVIDERAFVHPDARVEPGVTIGAFTVVEAGATIGEGSVLYPQVFVGANARIGSHTTLHPGVKIYHDCVVGDRCLLHANVVIGADGFGFVPQADGSFKKIAQIGNVVIENEVEIGANTAIDRATMGSTVIRTGAKLDNLIQIAHNVEIGSNTAVAAQTGIAGSVKIGERCMIGGQAGFAGHLRIADGVKIQAQSGVGRNIPEAGSAWYGSPAIPYNDYLRSYAVFRQLPDLIKKINELEQKLSEREP